MEGEPNNVWKVRRMRWEQKLVRESVFLTLPRGREIGAWNPMPRGQIARALHKSQEVGLAHLRKNPFDLIMVRRPLAACPTSASSLCSIHRRPLSHISPFSSPMQFIYFVIHIPITILIDSQGVFPSRYYPSSECLPLRYPSSECLDSINSVLTASMRL